jgi:uncharacterized protein YqhQ
MHNPKLKILGCDNIIYIIKQKILDARCYTNFIHFLGIISVILYMNEHWHMNEHHGPSYVLKHRCFRLYMVIKQDKYIISNTFEVNQQQKKKSYDNCEPNLKLVNEL